ncbi:MAG: hypothetical protein HYV07_31865 [Deltaproteobacteria bacterium]|nr:hypothetical protein [Deltaproteobacteria bacterium]
MGRTITAVVLVVAAGLSVLAYADWSQRKDSAEKGLEACTASGASRAACEAGIEAHGDECFNLSFHRGSRGVRSEGLTVSDYVECISLGPKLHKERHFERKQARDRERREMEQPGAEAQK